ncbi:c-type cytochrome biogenesis protein CcsB [Terrimesophilobacter mesophilus]|uniref:C-type cytochrome biogenesis protein CcsB n=2 Tax=Terrimesophilobacter mesophilus TaxID=433647 RepID=A0A4R8VDJ9_9MICO|nr:c-type cytochrome biogenesis protein CcsB [Terrimesophilobacter mesophilus]TFB80835.1 c-type cytochrome biogenesis protein CcsB [Terrimesophilobacter mesophilus]
MGVYLIAFVFFTLDLAKRSADAHAHAAAPVSVGQNAAAASRGTIATLEREAPASSAAPPRRIERAALALTALAWVLHVAGAVLRGLADGHVPWSNMFEFSLVSSAIAVGVFLFLQFWQDLRFLGTYISGFALIVLGVGTVNFYVPVTPLPPALQSYWLIIHVFVATLGTAFFAVGAGLSIVQLLQARREADRVSRLRFLGTMPKAEKLENLAYRVIVVGFVFWTFTLIAGSIWAFHAWGRYWGWDTKEVWTFIIWVLFAGYIHARATRGWRGSRSAWLAIVGFGAVAFNYTIVNLFFKGLHVYSGL